MCSGAIGLAHPIPKKVTYGASNQKFGAGSLYDILWDGRLNHRVEVETGVMEEGRCAKIMQDFFRQSRERKKKPNDWKQDKICKQKCKSQGTCTFIMEDNFCFPEEQFRSLFLWFFFFLSC